ncbi:hypothetical protein CWATWH0003_2414 [Crocosphaera watsonii WH 0003]|nr:hypothetical protein CWATWH0003_2414 [Crocosphaera watsonii WH 0003]
MFNIFNPFEFRYIHHYDVFLKIKSTPNPPYYLFPSWEGLGVG